LKCRKIKKQFLIFGIAFIPQLFPETVSSDVALQVQPDLTFGGFVYICPQHIIEMTATDEIVNKINAFLVEEFEVEPEAITPDANLKETLNLDSLDYVDLVVVIESNFGFKVKGEDFINIKTFQDFYDYINSRVGQN
jgi:acyl carrier protein